MTEDVDIRLSLKQVRDELAFMRGICLEWSSQFESAARALRYDADALDVWAYQFREAASRSDMAGGVEARMIEMGKEYGRSYPGAIFDFRGFRSAVRPPSPPSEPEESTLPPLALPAVEESNGNH